MKSYAGILTLLWVGLAWLSLSFQHYHQPETRPIGFFVLLMMVLTVVSTMATCKSRSCGNWSYKKVLLWAFLFRLILIPSNPIQEDDFYRYLWDGAVLKEGVNPFFFAPEEVSQTAATGIERARFSLEGHRRLDNLPLKPSIESLTEDMKTLVDLSHRLTLDELHYDRHWNPETRPEREHIAIIKRVNHGSWPTVYPPLAQALFAFASAIGEGSLWVLRCCFLLVDMGTCFLLVGLLRCLSLDTSRVAWYAWNPLVIKEYINSPHVDVLLTFFVALCLYFWVRRSSGLSIMAACLGCLSKLLTLFFLPFLVVWEKRKASYAVLGLLLVVLGFSLFSQAGERQWTSLQLMGHQFKMNSMITTFVEPLAENLLNTLGHNPAEEVEVLRPFFLYGGSQNYSQPTRLAQVTRQLILVMALIFVFLWWFKGFGLTDRRRQVLHLGWLLTGLLLLSPVANPWYFAVLAVFLTVKTSIFQICLLALVSLYYLRFSFLYQPELAENHIFKDFDSVLILETIGIFLAALAQWALEFRKSNAGETDLGRN